MFSQDNTDQSRAAFIDDPFQRFTEAGARTFGHMTELGGKSFVYKLMQRLPENVGFPDPRFITLKFLQQIIDTGNLDGKSGREVLSLLKYVSKELGVTLILVTHDLNVAEQADRVITIEDGAVIKDSKNTSAQGE